VGSRGNAIHAADKLVRGEGIEPADAEELHAETARTPAQRLWLARFCARWWKMRGSDGEAGAWTAIADRHQAEAAAK
jgi:hypothetical protein